MMEFAELTGAQRRQLIDARQVFGTFRDTEGELRHRVRGRMHWRRIQGKDYLYHVAGKVKRSLGARGPETEQVFQDFTEQRARVVLRHGRLRLRLDEMAPVNRAMMLGRVPVMAARILRRLDAAGLLGRSLFVIGTHALFAYEAASGVIFDSGLTATEDLDLLWDARRRLSLALVDARAEGVIGLLKKVDHTFEARPGSFRAANDDDYLVDLVRPLEKDEMRSGSMKVTATDDMEAAGIAGLEWLINAPKFDQIAMADDGRMTYLPTIDPRAFAVHKWWISRQESRNPLKRRRDADQARAVAQVARTYLGLRFEAKDLTAVPKRLLDAAPELLAAL